MKPSRPSPRQGAGSITVPFLVFCALLLIFLIGDVTRLMPHKTPDEQKRNFLMRQAIRNSFMAKEMVGKLLPTPPTRWEHGIRCGEIGHGVWFAQGTVEINLPDGETSTPWQALFLPATSQPLYLVVGSRSQGDAAAALRLAGVQPPNP